MKRWKKVIIGLVCAVLVATGGMLYAADMYDPMRPARLQLGTQCSLAFVAADTTKTCTLSSVFLNAELHSLKLIMPAFAVTAPTATILILDATGSTIYSQAGIAESTTTYIPLSRPVTFNSSYVILLTTTAGTGGGTVTIDSWVYK